MQGGATFLVCILLNLHLHLRRKVLLRLGADKNAQALGSVRRPGPVAFDKLPDRFR